MHLRLCSDRWLYIAAVLRLSEGQLTDPHLAAEEATFSTTHTSQETLASFLNVKSYTKTSVNMAEFLGS